MKQALAVIAPLWLALASPAFAQHVPPMSDVEIAGLLDEGFEVEARVDGDFNGDGEIDTAFVQKGEELRGLIVSLAYRDNLSAGHEPLGSMALDPYPVQGAAVSLSVTDKGVLVVEDLTGGTSAVASTYRLRYDRKEHRMRLIGLDAEYYSRTFAHGYYKVSWNLLTGDYVEERADLAKDPTSDAAFGPPTVKRSKKPTKPIYMDDAPTAESLVSPQP